MASLKELEEDLKRLIEERNGLQPNFNTTNSNCDIRTYMAVEEHGQPFNKQPDMVIREHGQPFKEVWIDIEGNQHSSYERKLEWDNIIIRKRHEHAIKNGMCVTKMAVRGHGRPYRNTSSEKTLSKRVKSKINAVMGWK